MCCLLCVAYCLCTFRVLISVELISVPIECAVVERVAKPSASSSASHALPARTRHTDTVSVLCPFVRSLTHRLTQYLRSRRLCRSARHWRRAGSYQSCRAHRRCHRHRRMRRLYAIVGTFVCDMPFNGDTYLHHRRLCRCARRWRRAGSCRCCRAHRHCRRRCRMHLLNTV